MKRRRKLRRNAGMILLGLGDATANGARVLDAGGRQVARIAGAIDALAYLLLPRDGA